MAKGRPRGRERRENMFNLFLNDDKTRKSPLTVYAFLAGLAYCVVFGVFFALLTDPLHHLINTGSAAVSTFLHSLIISLAGALVCCLFFLLPDKRIAMGGFIVLALLLAAGFLMTFLLEAGRRPIIRQLLVLYGLGPVLVGNAVGFVFYRAIRERKAAGRGGTQ